MRAIYPEKYAAALESALTGLRAAGQDEEADALVAPFVARMHDLSVFVQELKSRFTRWFNQRHDRRGTLWEERFRSVLIEGTSGRLRRLRLI